MTLIRWLITLPVVVIVVTFCVANTGDIAVMWSPLHEPVEIPLYAVGLGALSLGFIWGVLLISLQAVRLRVQARRQRKQIDKLEKQLADSSKTPANSNTNAPREPAEQHIEKLPGA